MSWLDKLGIWGQAANYAFHPAELNTGEKEWLAGRDAAAEASHHHQQDQQVHHNVPDHGMYHDGGGHDAGADHGGGW